jgi:hypothetical protein
MGAHRLSVLEDGGLPCPNSELLARQDRRPKERWTPRPSDALALLLAAATIAGCTGAAASGDAEQFIVAYSTCVPDRLRQPPLGNGTLSTGLVRGDIIADFTHEPDLYATPEQVRCVLAAGGDCSGVRACFAISIQVGGGSCASASLGCGSASSIEGCHPAGEFGGTSPAFVETLDCSLLDGQACAAGSSPVVCACTMGSVATCEGNVRVTGCMGGPALRRPCPDGTTCVESVGAVPVDCVGAGPACSQDTCVGDVLHPCDLSTGRERAAWDCAADGMHCSSTATGAQCVPTSRECAMLTSACDGPRLRYCAIDGSIRTYDCAAHGFGPCIEATEPATPRCTDRGPQVQ